MRVSEWVAVGGLLVAALSLLIGYLDRRHARSEALRTAVFERQLALIGLAARVVAELLEAVNRHAPATDADGHVVIEPTPEARAGLTASIAVLRTFIARHRAVLPRRTLGALAELLEHSSGIALGDQESERQWTRALNGFYRQARADLGIDPLGERIRQLTGVAGVERDAAIRRPRE